MDLLDFLIPSLQFRGNILLNKAYYVMWTYSDPLPLPCPHGLGMTPQTIDTNMNWEIILHNEKYDSGQWITCQNEIHVIFRSTFTKTMP